MTERHVLDEPPQVDSITDYDRSHLTGYLRLLDAAAESADWREVAQIVLGLDANDDASRAFRVYEAHLARARWMTRQGYRGLIGAASSK